MTVMLAVLILYLDSGAQQVINSGDVAHTNEQCIEQAVDKSRSYLRMDSVERVRFNCVSLDIRIYEE